MTNLYLLLCRIDRDQHGATVIELAFIMPVMLMFIFGILQLGMIFQGQAGISHALGQGARMATLHPTPDDAAIKQKMQTSMFKAQNFGSYVVSDPVRTGLTIRLHVKYTMPMKFYLVSLPDIVIQKEKIVYTASKVS